VNAPAEPYTFLLNAHSRAQRRENALSMQKPVSGLLRLGTTPGMSAESEGDGTETAATAPGADAPDPASVPAAPGPDPPRGRALIAQWTVFWTIVVLLLAAIFVVQNTEDVRIDILLWTVTVPLAAALLLTLAAGGLIASLFSLVRQHQYRSALRRRSAGDR
jgi:uncharacterized integral membrane protein